MYTQLHWLILYNLFIGVNCVQWRVAWCCFSAEWRTLRVAARWRGWWRRRGRSLSPGAAPARAAPDLMTFKRNYLCYISHETLKLSLWPLLVPENWSLNNDSFSCSKPNLRVSLSVLQEKTIIKQEQA